ncbi:RNA polymerase sigma factor [Leadbetterella sp. DM7]|uniref:RNA polymerase sigma factor n=1 Tax=Leadbetterella sp. DM7 TaxID=3235085 RepID=UPI00349EC34A
MVKRTELTDTQWWIEMKQGDEAALGILIKKHFNALLNYGYRFVKDEDFVKDCVQEIFIELWQRREKISTPDSVKAYLLSSVRKKVLRENYRQQVFREEPDFGGVSDRTGAFDRSAEWVLIENETVSELREKVKRSINRLSKRQQEVLYLQYFQNLSREEISEIMNINLQSVSNLIQTAFSSFRNHWTALALLAAFYHKIIQTVCATDFFKI